MYVLTQDTRQTYILDIQYDPVARRDDILSVTTWEIPRDFDPTKIKTRRVCCCAAQYRVSYTQQ